MKNFFSKFRTLAQIQGSFNQIITDLENLRARNARSIEKTQIVISIAQSMQNELTEENLKAQKFQKNLEALMGE